MQVSRNVVSEKLHKNIREASDRVVYLERVQRSKARTQNLKTHHATKQWLQTDFQEVQH